MPSSARPIPAPGSGAFVDTGRAAEVLPELPALRLEQDPIHRHKDVLTHTIAVVAKTPPRLRVRMAALLHDIGKPATRAYVGGTVTFHHHEAVGAKLTRKRLARAGLRRATFVARRQRDGAALGPLQGLRRRLERRRRAPLCRGTPGPLLGDLNELVRCDCTTRNRAKADRLQEQVDDLERRIGELAAEDRRRAERPAIDGNRVMALLGHPARAAGRRGDGLPAGAQAVRRGDRLRRGRAPAQGVVGAPAPR